MDKRDIIKQKITEKLHEVFQSDGMVKGSLVIDRRHDFCVRVEDPSLDFWDDDTLDHIETILTQSPKSEVQDIVIFYNNATFCIVIKPLRPSAVWIIRSKYQPRLSYPLPYKQWREELLNLLMQLGETG